jgi:hypothetical protein
MWCTSGLSCRHHQYPEYQCSNTIRWDHGLAYSADGGSTVYSEIREPPPSSNGFSLAQALERKRQVPGIRELVGSSRGGCVLVELGKPVRRGRFEHSELGECRSSPSHTIAAPETSLAGAYRASRRPNGQAKRKRPLGRARVGGWYLRC